MKQPQKQPQPHPLSALLGGAGGAEGEPSVAKITLTQPCKVSVSQIAGNGISGPFRATILREGKPDLDAFGPTPFDALYSAVLQEWEDSE